MKPAVHFAQPIARYVRVNFGRADILVSEQFLNHAQIGAMFQQMCRKTVAQHVGRDVSGYARVQSSFLNAKPHCHG